MESKQSRSGQFPIRGPGQITCPDHQSEFFLCCKQCEGQLLCLECAIYTHQGHKFCKISDVAAVKKQKIQNYVTKAEKTQLPQIKQNIEIVDKQIGGNKKITKVLAKRIFLHGEKLKAEINRIVQEFQDTLKKIERSNRDLLCQYQQDLLAVYDKLCDRVDKCKKTISSGDNIAMIDVEKDSQKELITPSAPSLQNVDFNEGPTSQLQADVGQLSIQTEKLKMTSQEVQRCRSHDSNVVSEFKYPTKVTSVEKCTSNSVWVSYHNDTNVSLVTLHGKVKQKVKLCDSVCDISISTLTGNLWLCCHNNTVYEVVGNRVRKQFKTNSCSWWMCMTPDNKIVVTTEDDKVIVYSTTGEVLQSCNSIVSPYGITACTSTGRLAVCDRDSPDEGGEGKPSVIFFNSKLEIEYQYYGPDPDTDMEYDFRPFDIVFDKQGRLLVTDNYNDCIQLVSGDGHFLCIIHTDTLQPTFLTQMQHDLLCVCFFNVKEDDDVDDDDDVGRTIKIIQYNV